MVTVYCVLPLFAAKTKSKCVSSRSFSRFSYGSIFSYDYLYIYLDSQSGKLHLSFAIVEYTY